MNNKFKIYLPILFCLFSIEICLAGIDQNLPRIYEEVLTESGFTFKKYGYIAPDGTRLTEPIFDKANPFDPNGLALVSYNSHYGYINTKGEYYIEVGLKDAHPFDQFHVTAIKMDKKWGLINDTNADVWVMKDVLDFIDNFQPNGLAIVKYENKFGLVDTLGNVVLPVIYDKIEKFDKNGYAYIKNDNKIGVVDKRGRAIVPPEYKNKKGAMAAATELKAKLAKPSEISLADLAAQARKDDGLRNEQARKDEEARLRAEQARKDEEARLLAEKARKDEEARLLADKARKDEEARLLAEQARKDEEARLLAEQARKDEEARLLAEQARKDEEARLLAEQARKDEEARLLAEQARKDEEARLLAEQARKDEEMRRQAEARKRLEQTPTLKNYIAANLGEWNDFLASKELNLPLEEDIRNLVEEEVGKWQVKGEFEPTARWKERVNETTRAAKVNAIADSIFAINSKKVEAVRAEYREKYEALADKYCAGIAEQFASQTLEIKPYDADNETFLISTSDFGDFLLPVPLDEAPGFKKEWDKWKSTAIASFVPNGEDVVLKSVSIGKYKYDSEMDAKYAQVDVEYNFRPIDVAQLTHNLDAGSDMAMNSGNNQGNTIKGFHTEKIKISAGNTPDIDLNIPEGVAPTIPTFAVVIANGEYAHASKVAHAENDGRVMAQYLIRTLGIPESNVATFINATYGQIASAISMLQDIGDAYHGSDFNLIFYYVGHGLPDDEGKKSYILPVDIDPRMVSICMPLEKIYADLGNLGAKNVTVMVDACFSGTNHGEGMLVPQSMGVALKPKKAAPVGNMVVLTAADGNETAFPYEEKNHGLFTYWLLKKLQDTAGQVTFGELSDYVIDNVKKTAVTVNKKPQTPTVATSPQLTGSWRNMKFGH